MALESSRPGFLAHPNLATIPGCGLMAWCFISEAVAVNKIFCVLTVIALLFCSKAAHASDGFGSVRCGSDIAKALIGRTMSNEPVAAIAARHKSLGLEDFGGSEISERLFLISWRICGDEYALLEEKDVVRDVLKFPAHSKDSPEFIGACRIDGKQAPDTIIAVLENHANLEDPPAKAAWKIDERRSRFVEVPGKGLLCPRDGVITDDGGR
jgi:hypothetical protein